MAPGRWWGKALDWRDRTVADARFRAWATRFPLTRPVARRRARALFDLCAGFVYSQVLYACVELRLFEALAGGPRTQADLAAQIGLPPDRAERLLAAAASLRLLSRRGKSYGLGPLGAAMIDNAAVTAMVRHHAMLYADLADPVALLRAPSGGTHLAQYWPYGTEAEPAGLTPGQVAAYSDLMAASQPLVAAQLLDAYDFRRHRCLLDLGGGDGTFIVAAAKRAPGLRFMLFDLPEVAARARERFQAERVAAEAYGGDLRRDSLPPGADLVTLIRVIHDHDDPAALAMLRAARQALGPDGTLLLAEPMADTQGAEPVGAYFAFYLLALGSGRARSQATLTAMLGAAGFSRIRARRTANPLLASLLVAQP